MVRWDDGTLLIEFDSPWSPPVEFLRHVQRMYPKLDFELLYMERKKMEENQYKKKKTIIRNNDAKYGME